MDESSQSARALFLPRQAFQALLDALHDHGFRCIGPRVRDGAIVYDALQRVSELPRGWRATQEPGAYRMQQGDDERLFAWANGPQALKPLTFAPRETLWKAERDATGVLRFRDVRPASDPIAVIGVRACDLAALHVQDRVFLGAGRADPNFAARRRQLFLVAVNCSHPAATCFCASTGDGPSASAGYDIALTELDEGFVTRIGSEAGTAVTSGLGLKPATDAQLFAAGRQHSDAVKAQQRQLPPVAQRLRLMERLDHPRWKDVAERCLSCGNCTMVCPTCFCHSEEEQPTLDATSTEHVREWDSCFTRSHSYIHGMVVRPDTRTRYRQWLTHKLATWHEQYGVSGCVGCGRCIAWCPVGIDLTEEVAVISGGAP